MESGSEDLSRNHPPQNQRENLEQVLMLILIKTSLFLNNNLKLLNPLSYNLKILLLL